jgi:lipoprotein signal peptidase
MLDRYLSNGLDATTSINKKSFAYPCLNLADVMHQLFQKTRGYL